MLILSLPLMASDRPEAIGYYSNGTLLNGQNMATEGEGFMRLYLEHNRGFGTLEMITPVTEAAAEIFRLYPDRGRLQVEDLSQEKGGKIDRHGSHQNGLDVDLTYFRVDGLEHTPTPEQKFSPSMVIKNKISPNFDAKRNWEFVKSLHKFGKVNRIFMDQIIKKELCRYANSINELVSYTEVLRSIRHEANHQDHLHVRMHCPELDKQCRPQAAPAPGHGCPKRL